MKINIIEFKKSLFIVWRIISVVLLFILLLSLFGSERFIYLITPKCYSITQFNVECIFCGMTRAFVAISKYQDFNLAVSLNRGSIYLYSCFLLNSIFFMYKIKKRIDFTKIIFNFYIN